MIIKNLLLKLRSFICKKQLNLNWLYRLWVSLKLAYKTLLLKISRGKITSSEVMNILKNYTNASNIRISDNYFTITDLKTMKNIINFSPIKFRKYQTEIYDCDDYSFGFMGLMRFIIPNFAVGIVWTHNHALNFCIIQNKELYFIEPQTNEIYKPSKNIKIQLMII